MKIGLKMNSVCILFHFWNCQILTRHFPIANHILRSSVLVVISLFKSLLKINNFPYKLMPRRKVIISFYDKIKYFNYSTNIEIPSFQS